MVRGGWEVKVKEIVASCCGWVDIQRRMKDLKIVMSGFSGEGCREHACGARHLHVKLSFLHVECVAMAGGSPEQRAELVQEPVTCVELVME